LPLPQAFTFCSFMLAFIDRGISPYLDSGVM
jgi:hypothetical protein